MRHGDRRGARHARPCGDRATGTAVLRCALGASGTRILALALARALAVAAAGVTLGIGSVALLAPRVRRLLFGVSPWDPPTYVAVSLALLDTAALLPARRAAGLEPNAVRSD